MLEDLFISVKAGNAARFNFMTEWNPQRILNASIEAKRDYEFSFRVMTGSELASADPKIEFLVSGYNYPLHTLFLDNISLGETTEYSFQLWWARGVKNRNTLKNAKLVAVYVSEDYSGGYEVVTCDWLSCKVGDGDFEHLPSAGLALGDIPCDSYLNIVLKVECPQCALTRGLVYFNLYIKGDHEEPVYAGPVVFGGGARYYTGLGDDYTSDMFVTRLQIIP